MTDSGIDVDGRGVRGVEIELTNRRQQVAGLVTDAKGSAVTDYVVLLFSQDRLRWTAAGNRYFSSSRPGDDGRFKVGTLPPGEYYAIALDRTDSADWGDPEFLEGLIRHASPFSLASRRNEDARPEIVRRRAALLGPPCLRPARPCPTP